MSTTYGLFIGIEKYKSANLKPVRFAEKDAKEVRDAFISQGCLPENLELLLTDDATHAIMETRLRRVAENAGKEDCLIIFYAGHGLFAHGNNYLTCVDSQVDEIARTCIPIQDIFDFFQASHCTRSALFLDACHSGVEISDSMRDTIDSMSERALDAFFKDSEYRIGFASCRADQKSYSSTVLKNGIWSHFLVKALKGEVPSILDENSRITGTSLQDYLADRVPKMVKSENSTTTTQTPQMFGRYSKTFVIGDVSTIVEKRNAALKIGIKEVRDLHFVGTEVDSVKSLSGWRKGYFVSDRLGSSDVFFRKLCEGDVEELSEDFFQGIRESCGYGIDDIERYSEPPYGSIITPDFVLDLAYSVNVDNTSEYTLRYDLNKISSPEILQNEKLNRVLDGIFDTVVISLNKVHDIKDVIRALEKDKSLKLKYPSSLDHCIVWVPGVGGSITIKPRSLELNFDRRTCPTTLLDKFREATTALARSPNLATLLG